MFDACTYYNFIIWRLFIYKKKNYSNFRRRASRSFSLKAMFLPLSSFSCFCCRASAHLSFSMYALALVKMWSLLGLLSPGWGLLTGRRSDRSLSSWACCLRLCRSNELCSSVLVQHFAVSSHKLSSVSVMSRSFFFRYRILRSSTYKSVLRSFSFGWSSKT